MNSCLNCAVVSLKLSPTNDFVQSVNNAFLNKLNYIKSFILCVFFFFLHKNQSLMIKNLVFNSRDKNN